MFTYSSQTSSAIHQLKRAVLSLGWIFGMLWTNDHLVRAKITNDALDPMIGYNAADAQSGQLFVNYFIYIWNVLMLVGGLVVLLFFVQAAIEWITAGGDSGKITKARDRMLQSTIGLFLLVFSFVIVNFISSLLFAGTGFNILDMTITSPGIGS